MKLFTLERNGIELVFAVYENGRKAKLLTGTDNPPRYMGVPQAREEWKKLVSVGWKRLVK